MTSTKKKTLIISLCAAGVVLVGVAVLLIVLLGGKDCAHEKKSYTITQAATCIAEGQQSVKCDDCGEDLGTEKLPKSVHNYEKQSTSVAATCSTAGKDVFKCKVCNDTYETGIAKLDHNFQNVADQCAVATCTTAGKTVKKCATCDVTEIVDIPALGHSWALNGTNFGEDVKAADCVSRKCSICEEEALATKSHTYKVTLDTATCTVAGEVTYTCTGCNDFYTEESPAKGHSVEEWTLDDTFTPTLVQDTTCTYNYQNKGMCTRCNTEQTAQYQANVHNFKLEVVDTATCEVAGTKVMTCVCGITTGTPVSYFAEHSWTGEGATKTCSDCGEKRTTVTSNEATLNKDDLKQEVELQSGAVVRLPDTVAGQVSSSATLAANNLNKNDIAEGTPGLDRVGDTDTIFNLTLTEGTNQITSFTSAVTVKLPYTLGTDEDPSRVAIFYLGSEGIELIEAVFTPNAPDSNEGYVTFTTDHFSYYLVGLYSDSELCERFGHMYLVSAKEPTCTEGGYYIESCKRCGSYGRRDIYSALGHTGDVDESKENTTATCTEKGTTNYVCAVCAHEYSVVTPAKGHKFVADEENSVAATCTASGKRVETCANCGQSHNFTLPQLPHTLRSVVTAPTCTDGGYTTHTCATCEGYSYTNQFTPATGHKWDIPAATCADGQVCLVCSAKGAPATGNHTMVGGKCSTCGFGCVHTDAVKQVVAPGCTEGGYTIFACTKCHREEKKDYTSPAGHAYENNFEPCTVCGAANADMANAVENLLKSLATTGYTIRLQDITMKVKETTRIEDRPAVSQDVVDMTLELGELYLSMVDEVGVVVYLNGSITVKNYDGAENGGAITVYGDGTNLYIKANIDGEEPIIRVSYDAAVNAVVTMVQNNMGGSSNKDEAIPMALTTEEDSEMTIGEMLAGMIESIVTNPIAAPWITLLQENTSLMYRGFGELILTFFTSEKVEDGYKYSFDYDMLQQFNKDLHDLKMSEFIDKYLGEGTTDEIFAYLEKLPTKKLTDLVTELVAFATEKGLPVELMLTTVNSLAPMFLPVPEGETFDILEFVNTSFGPMTFGDLYTMLGSQLPEGATLPAFAEILTEAKKALTEYALYDLIPEEEGELMFSGYNAFLDGDMVYFYFVTDKDGKLVRIESGFDNFTWVGGMDSDPDDGIVEIDEIEYSLNAAMSFLFSATIPEGADAIKGEFDAIAAKLEASANAAFTENPENTLGIFEVKDVEGVSTLYTIIPVDAETMLELTLDELGLMMFMNDCTNAYSVMLAPDASVFFGMGSGAMFVFNAETNEFSYESFHLYDEEYEGTYPDGYYKTFDDAPCGEYYGTLYQCECGDLVQKSNGGYKEHLEYRTVELLGDDCEDGVMVTTKCYHEGCDYIRVYVNNNEYDSWNESIGSIVSIHNTHICSEEIVEIPTNHAEETGKTYLKINRCPCGWTENSNVENYEFRYENGCQFGIVINGGSNNGYDIYVYTCAIESCDIAIVKMVYSDASTEGETCVWEEKTVYKVVKYNEADIPVNDDDSSNGNEVYNFWANATAVENMTYTVTDHYQLHQVEILQKKDTETHDISYVKCKNCTLQSYNETKHDSYGRMIYSLDWRMVGGKYVDFDEWKYVYKTSPACECDYYYRDDPAEKLEKRGNSYMNHMWVQSTVIPGTCTQPDIVEWTCSICNEVDTGRGYDYSWWHHDYYWGHNWTSTDPESGFNYECEYCGLLSNKGNGYLSLEDLTDNANYGSSEKIVIGYEGQNMNRFDILFAFVPTGMNYGDGETPVVPAASILSSLAYDNEYNFGDKYEDSNFSFGRVTFDKQAILDAANGALNSGDPNVTVDNQDAFLAGYDLAIIFQSKDDPSVGDGVGGTYTVIVLEDLAAYFA